MEEKNKMMEDYGQVEDPFGINALTKNLDRFSLEGIAKETQAQAAKEIKTEIKKLLGLGKYWEDLAMNQCYIDSVCTSLTKAANAYVRLTNLDEQFAKEKLALLAVKAVEKGKGFGHVDSRCQAFLLAYKIINLTDDNQTKATLGELIAKDARGFSFIESRCKVYETALKFVRGSGGSEIYVNTLILEDAPHFFPTAAKKLLELIE